MSELERNKTLVDMRNLVREVYPDVREIMSKWELYMAYVLQRTLSERASEKYQHLQAEEKGVLVFVYQTKETNQFLSVAFTCRYISSVSCVLK